MILNVLKWPDPRLQRVADVVSPNCLGGALDLTIANMAETMRASRGIGLAAPQIGLSMRFFIMAQLSTGDIEKPPMVVINPEVLRASPKLSSWEEGCLSVDGTVQVSRPKWIYARWYDENWHQHTERLSHLVARCFLHELDHLDGWTIADTRVAKDPEAPFDRPR